MKRIVMLVLPFVFIFIYIVIASFQLLSPGLNYDELLFTNAALGPIDHNFVDVRIGNFPLMLMNYIGALKAYIYYPIFKLFGVSAFTIRFPMILLFASGLYILYHLSQTVFGKKTAIVVLLISFLDPIGISHSRMDVGPAVISFFCKTTSLYFFFLFIKRRKSSALLMFCLFCLLGLYNKLNFIWFLVATFISITLFYRKPVLGYVQKTIPVKMQKVGVSICILLCLSFLYVLKKLSFLEMIDFFYFKHLLYVIHELFYTLNGQLFLTQSLGMGKLVAPFYTIAGWLISLAIILSTGICLQKRFKNKEAGLSFHFLFCIAAVIYFQIIITSNAGVSWHIFELYPFIPLLFGVSLVTLFESETILAILLSSIILYQGAIYSLYSASYNRPDISSAWSKDIYKLINYTKKQDKQFVTMDWGIHTQLQAFDHVKGKYFDGWGVNDDRKVPSEYYKVGTLIIFHNNATTSMKLAKELFFKQLPPTRLLKLHKTIGMYEVWEVEKK